MVEEVIERDTLKQILDNDINGHNFMVYGKLEECQRIEHIQILYSRQEKVYVVLFEQSLRDILAEKIKGLNELLNVPSKVS